MKEGVEVVKVSPREEAFRCKPRSLRSLTLVKIRIPMLCRLLWWRCKRAAWLPLQTVHSRLRMRQGTKETSSQSGRHMVELTFSCRPQAMSHLQVHHERESEFIPCLQSLHTTSATYRHCHARTSACLTSSKAKVSSCNFI